MRYLKIVLVCCSALTLGACAYSVESSHQDISFVTPGAEDAVCYVNVDDVKYKVYPPQSLNIKKSDKDMFITCKAPGNRVREMEVPATMTERALWGTPVGMAWDYASQSLFYYPSVIAIDFSQEDLVPNKPPKHNNSDIKQPEEYDLEEFRPSAPRMNSDKHNVSTPLLRRGEEYSDEAIEEMQSDSTEGGKGDMQSLLDTLTSSDTAGVEGDSGGEAVETEAAGDPVSLYPGQ